MNHLSLIRIACLFCLFPLFQKSVSAQVRATTASGNRVLLFDNGTWKYDEANTAPTQTTANSTSLATPTQAQVQPAAEVAKPVTIDVSTNRKSDSFDLFNVESPRLVRFFGPVKGKINCKSSAMVEEGQVILCLEWQAQVGDANRYFGVLKDGVKIDLELENGKIIPLTYTEQFDSKYLEKYSLSIFKGGFVLDQEQITLLSSSKVRSCVSHWKKKEEEYKFTDGFGIQKALKTLK